jgi:NADH-quinone oxidoreductase subunit G
VSTDQGAVIVPVAIAEMPDGVVWLPTNARDCRTRATLGAGHGSTVSLTRSDAPPVVGVEAE